MKFDKFWDNFDEQDNFFTRILSKRYVVEISEDPDFYFFTHSYFGKENYLHYKCHRIFIGFENSRADWNICDYVLDSDVYSNNPRHKRFPLWAMWNLNYLKQELPVDILSQKTKFCCIVVSNGKAKERIEFFNQLSRYKKVDSGGRYLNNVGGPVPNKMEFIKDYKFVISFENSSYPGYTTEKLVEPILVNSIPIYWGNPEVGNDFNVNRFINITDTVSYSSIIDKIIRLDQDDDQYLEVINEPLFVNDKMPAEFGEESLLNFLDFVIEDSKFRKPVGEYFSLQYFHRARLLKNKGLSYLSKKIRKSK